MTRVLVCGSRHYRDRRRVYQVLDAAVERLGLTSILQGGARGADRLAFEWAGERGIPRETIKADWDGLGRAAGPIRNQKMVDEKPDIVIAFPGGDGTKDLLARAEYAGIRVILIDWK